MNGPREQFDRELDMLTDRLNRGEMLPAEYNAEIREMERNYRAEMEDAAQSAFDAEMERW